MGPSGAPRARPCRSVGPGGSDGRAALAGSVAIAWHLYGGGYLASALVTAVTLWAGFTAARVITHDAFEGRPSQLTLLTIGFELASVLLMARVIGLWPPAGTV